MVQLSSLEYPQSNKGHAGQEWKRTEKASKKNKTLKSRGMVTIPYIKGLSEVFTMILKAYRICTAVKPHSTLRNMLVHPKDRISSEEKPVMIYNTHTHMHAHTHTQLFYGSGFCPGQPGWAGTRRNIHPLTLIMVINHPYMDLQHTVKEFQELWACLHWRNWKTTGNKSKITL